MSKLFIHPSAEVSSHAKVGEGTKVWNNAQVREGAVIGKDCTLGMAVYVDAEVRIGDRVKIQNGTSVYHGVTLGDDVFVGPAVSFTNDLYPRAFDPDWEIHRTYVMTGASIGSNSTIVCGVTLHPYCMVGAGSVVTRDVPPHALVRGNPARHVDYVCKCGRPLKVGVAAPLPREATCHGCGETLNLALVAEFGK